MKKRHWLLLIISIINLIIAGTAFILRSQESTAVITPPSQSAKQDTSNSIGR